MSILTVNKPFPSLDAIKKYNNTSYGLMLMALSMIDKINKGLEINVDFDSTVNMIDSSDQILAILYKFSNIKVYVRTVKQENIYLDKYSLIEHKLENNRYPLNPNMYMNNIGAILDIDINIKSHTFNFYINPETTPRVLKLNIN